MIMENILVKLLMINQKEKEFIIIKMVIDMKEIIKMIKKMEKEFIIMLMVIDMKEIIKMD